jgi:hypothetical protein
VKRVPEMFYSLSYEFKEISGVVAEEVAGFVVFRPIDIVYEEEQMVLNVPSTHKGHIATKAEERTVENELKSIKHKKSGTDREDKFVDIIY